MPLFTRHLFHLVEQVKVERKEGRKEGRKETDVMERLEESRGKSNRGTNRSIFSRTCSEKIAR